MSLLAYVHNIDPYVIDALPIHWYGVSYLLGFFIGYLVIRRVLSVGVSTLKPQQATDLVVTLALGIVIGGRLGYAVFYRPSLLWTRIDGFPYWDLLAINHGGMASLWGFRPRGRGLTAIKSAAYYARRNGITAAPRQEEVTAATPGSQDTRKRLTSVSR